MCNNLNDILKTQISSDTNAQCEHTQLRLFRIAILCYQGIRGQVELEVVAVKRALGHEEGNDGERRIPSPQPRDCLPSHDLTHKLCLQQSLKETQTHMDMPATRQRREKYAMIQARNKDRVGSEG